MAVNLLENFNIIAADDAAVKAALAGRGFIIPSTNYGSRTFSIKTFTENGVTRHSLLENGRQVNSAGQNLWSIPNVDRPYYFSLRVRFSGDTSLPAGSNAQVFYVTSVNGASTAASMIVGQVAGAAGSHYVRWYFGQRLHELFKDIPAGEFAVIECMVEADGTVYVWINDELLYQQKTIPASTFIYFGGGQVGTLAVDNPYIDMWEISDICLVDPTQPGLQNRPGSSMRIVDVPFTNDVQANWIPPEGVTDPHYQLMADYTQPVDTDVVLTGNVVGMRDQYQAGSVPQAAEGNDQVLSLKIDKRTANDGGATHSYATEIDVGSGIQEIETVMLSPGAGFAYQPVYLDTKPDDSNWTAADVANLKAGLSVKS